MTGEVAEVGGMARSGGVERVARQRWIFENRCGNRRAQPRAVGHARRRIRDLMHHVGDRRAVGDRHFLPERQPRLMHVRVVDSRDDDASVQIDDARRVFADLCIRSDRDNAISTNRNRLGPRMGGIGGEDFAAGVRIRSAG